MSWDVRQYERGATLYHCTDCGWWLVRESYYTSGTPDGSNWRRTRRSVTWPVIRSYSLGSSAIPVEVLRQHLLQSYSDVRSISARKAEELVLSVFRDV
jgi:hypothetical protein